MRIFVLSEALNLVIISAMGRERTRILNFFDP